jgi:ATP-dependent helicase/DNAse subunit B
MQNLIKLSASRIKTLQSCSWLYFCNYHLKLPQKNNTGAMRGTIAHLILEILSEERRRSLLKKIIKDNTCLKSPAIVRLIKKAANREGLDLTCAAESLKKDDIPIDNLSCIDDMIMVGIKFDFIKDRKTVGTELEFDITNENPKYRIGGFIDRIFEENGAAIIRDFKTSKKPFSPAELKDNIQAMMYSLAMRKNFEKYKDVIVKFLFLRFPDNPERECPTFSEEELNGFEHYLEYLTEYLSNFNEDSAKSNFASQSFKTKWMCKTKSGWKCPYLDPMKYKVLLDKNGSIIKSIFENENFSEKDLAKGEKVEERFYSGCPAWNFSAKNDFDL